MTDQLSTPPQIPARWVFALAAAVIAGAFGCVFVWFFFTAPPNLQYPIILGLVCFILSTVSCLLFASQTNIQATLPLAAITMGGPAVTWVAVLLIYTWLFPLPPITPQSFTAILREQVLREGWRTFPEWVKQVGTLREPILKDEANHIRYALDTAYFVGADRHKLAYPVIRTLFVYSESNAVSFRRLTGTKGDVVEIFAKGSTTQAGGASSLLLTKNNGKIVAAEMGGESEWKAIRSEVLDCLVITSFEEGMLPEGDLLMIDTNKYRKDGQAIIHVGILAPQTISEPKVWQVRGMAFPLPDEVPVVFKRSAATWEPSIEPLLGEFSEWLNLLDQPSPDPRLSPDALKFLQAVKNRLPDTSFASFHKSPIYKAKYAMRLDQVTEAIAITFEKK